MGKIGRNDPCTCGSGKKFKKCCLQQTFTGGTPQQQINSPPSVRKEVEKIQQAAGEKKNFVYSVGVFVLFSSESGDGWLLEVSDMDAVQVAAAGKALDVEIEENPETIEINWTHSFAIKDKKLQLTSYKDNTVTAVEQYPTHGIAAAVKKIRNKIPAELLNTIHVNEQGVEA